MVSYGMIVRIRGIDSSRFMTKSDKKIRKEYWRWQGKSYSYLPLRGGHGTGSGTRFLILLMQWWYERRWELLKLCLILSPCIMWGVLFLFAANSEKTWAKLFFENNQPLSLCLSGITVVWFIVGTFILLLLNRHARMKLLAEVHTVLHFIRLDTFKLINHFARHTRILNELQTERWHKEVELETMRINNKITETEKEYTNRKEQLDVEYDRKYYQIVDTLNAGLYEFSYDICNRVEDALDSIFKTSDKLKLACAIRLRVDKKNCCQK